MFHNWIPMRCIECLWVGLVAFLLVGVPDDLSPRGSRSDWGGSRRFGSAHLDDLPFYTNKHPHPPPHQFERFHHEHPALDLTYCVQMRRELERPCEAEDEVDEGKDVVDDGIGKEEDGPKAESKWRGDRSESG